MIKYTFNQYRGRIFFLSSSKLCQHAVFILGILSIQSICNAMSTSYTAFPNKSDASEVSESAQIDRTREEYFYGLYHRISIPNHSLPAWEVPLKKAYQEMLQLEYKLRLEFSNSLNDDNIMKLSNVIGNEIPKSKQDPLDLSVNIRDDEDDDVDLYEFDPMEDSESFDDQAPSLSKIRLHRKIINKVALARVARFMGDTNQDVTYLGAALGVVFGPLEDLTTSNHEIEMLGTNPVRDDKPGESDSAIEGELTSSSFGTKSIIPDEEEDYMWPIRYGFEPVLFGGNNPFMKGHALVISLLATTGAKTIGIARDVSFELLVRSEVMWSQFISSYCPRKVIKYNSRVALYCRVLTSIRNSTVTGIEQLVDSMDNERFAYEPSIGFALNSLRLQAIHCPDPRAILDIDSVELQELRATQVLCTFETSGYYRQITRKLAGSNNEDVGAKLLLQRQAFDILVALGSINMDSNVNGSILGAIMRSDTYALLYGSTNQYGYFLMNSWWHDIRYFDNSRKMKKKTPKILQQSWISAHAELRKQITTHCKSAQNILTTGSCTSTEDTPVDLGGIGLLYYYLHEYKVGESDNPEITVAARLKKILLSLGGTAKIIPSAALRTAVAGDGIYGGENELPNSMTNLMIFHLATLKNPRLDIEKMIKYSSRVPWLKKLLEGNYLRMPKQVSQIAKIFGRFNTKVYRKEAEDMITAFMRPGIWRNVVEATEFVVHPLVMQQIVQLGPHYRTSLRPGSSKNQQRLALASNQKGGWLGSIDEIMSRWGKDGYGSDLKRDEKDSPGHSIEADPSTWNSRISSELIQQLSALTNHHEIKAAIAHKTNIGVLIQDTIQRLKVPEVAEKLLILGRAEPPRKQSGLRDFLEKTILKVGRALLKMGDQRTSYIMWYGIIMNPDKIITVANKLNALNLAYQGTGYWTYHMVDGFTKALRKRFSALCEANPRRSPGARLTRAFPTVNRNYHIWPEDHRYREISESSFCQHGESVWKLAMNLAYSLLSNKENTAVFEGKFSDPRYTNYVNSKEFLYSFRNVFKSDAASHMYHHLFPTSVKKELRRFNHGQTIWFSSAASMAGQIHTRVGNVRLGSIFQTQAPYMGAMFYNLEKERRKNRISAILSTLTFAGLLTFLLVDTRVIVDTPGVTEDPPIPATPDGHCILSGTIWTCFAIDQVAPHLVGKAISALAYTSAMGALRQVSMLCLPVAGVITVWAILKDNSRLIARVDKAIKSFFQRKFESFRRTVSVKRIIELMKPGKNLDGQEMSVFDRIKAVFGRRSSKISS